MPSRPANKKAAPRRRKKSVRRKKAVVSWWWIAAAAAVLLLIILLPHILASGNPERGAAVPEGYRHFMVDLSHHNPRDIVWDSLKVVIDKEGHTSKNLEGAKSILPLSHVVMKATEGESHKDRHFADWWEEAAEAGISRGAYHFFRSSKDARLQAQNYIESVTLTHRDLPPILDIETVHSGCTRKQLNNKALQWLRMVQDHYSRTPIVYASDSFVKDWLDKEITDFYPLWIARYNSEPPRTDAWQYWQFTDQAVVYGVKGKVDLSAVR